MARALGNKAGWKTSDRTYEPLRRERDTLSAQPPPGAYDGKALFSKEKPVPPHVIQGGHDGGATPANDVERALDIAMGRRSFTRDDEA
jgi:hypothetical protein